MIAKYRRKRKRKRIGITKAHNIGMLKTIAFK